MLPLKHERFYPLQVVNLLRSEVVNFNRPKVVNLNRSEVVNFIGFSSQFPKSIIKQEVLGISFQNLLCHVKSNA